MARAYVPIQSDFPYHICARCNNREWFSIPMEEVWKIFEEQLYFLHHAFGFRIRAFVLMSNHYHLLVHTPQANLSEGMRWFMKEVSRQLNAKSGRINQVWGGRYFRSLIRSDHHYKNVYKYIYYNPVKAGLSERVLDYQFSTLRGLLGFEHLVPPVIDDILFEMGVENCVRWLDTPVHDQDWESVRKALKKVEFALPQSRKNKKPLLLETQLL